MAETSLLRQSAIVRNASIGTSPPSAPQGAVKTGELPLVQVKMTPGGPQVRTPQQKPVEILPPRDAHSAVRTGDLPMVRVKMTSQGPQPDDGLDKGVVILPPKDQAHAVAAGGLPMVQVKMTSGGPQVQNLPPVQSARPPIQAPQPGLSRPRVARGAAPPVGRTVRIAAPQPAQVPLPPLPEFGADQLMLCRHLVVSYLSDLRAADPSAQEAGEAGAQGATAESESPGADNIKLAAATLDTIDQALVSVAVRLEAETLAAEAQAAAAAEAPEVPVAAPTPTSVIPAAPTAAYVAGRVGGRPGGYAGGYSGGRVQRNAGMAPRRVSRSDVLPQVVVKMENGRSIVQNQAEVAAARAAALAAKAPEVEVELLDGNA